MFFFPDKLTNIFCNYIRIISHRRIVQRRNKYRMAYNDAKSSCVLSLSTVRRSAAAPDLIMVCSSC